MTPDDKRAVLAHLHTEIAAIKAPARPRWKCPSCGSTNVQLDMRAWFKETTDFDLTLVEVGECSSIQAWYCEDCGESEAGEPLEASYLPEIPCRTCGEPHDPRCGTDDLPEPGELRETGK